MKPVATPAWTLDELLAGINANNIHDEIDNDHAVGNEMWGKDVSYKDSVEAVLSIHNKE